MTYAHTIIFPEMIASKTAVIDLQGRMIGGPDLKMIDDWTKWVAWQRAVKAASSKPGQVPQKVMNYFQRTKGLTRAPTGRLGEPEDAVLIHTIIPDGGMIFDDPMNNGGIIRPTTSYKPPRFTWSYTSMQEFLTCPAQWAAKRFYKTIKDVESEAMRVGNMIHETAEHYLKSKLGQTYKPALIHTQYLQVVQKYCDALLNSGAELHVEKEMCFDKQMQVSKWTAWDTVWVRSKADVLARKDNKLNILDWKTGKYKKDFLQLKMFAVFAALTPGFDDVQEFDPKFIFTKEAPPKNILRLPEPIKRSELKGVLTEILGVVRRMEAAWESENFPAKKNGLCRQYCSNTDCTHCGG